MKKSLILRFKNLFLCYSLIYRSSRPEVFFQQGVLRNFAKFAGKHLCQSLQTCNFIKKETLVKVFSRGFFKEHLWWLLLILGSSETQQSLSATFFFQTAEHPLEVFYKKMFFLKNSQILTVKHLFWSLFLTRLQA